MEGVVLPQFGDKTSTAGTGLILQTAFADINIAKGGSVYYYLGRRSDRACRVDRDL